MFTSSSNNSDTLANEHVPSSTTNNINNTNTIPPSVQTLVQTLTPQPVVIVPPPQSNKVPYIPGAPYIPGQNPYSGQDALNYSAVDTILEKEKQHNKTETWNKIDKTVKIQKLHSFAERYGREQGLPVKEIKNLKVFFVDCLDKAKLQKTKDVVYDKDSREITSIPALHFNTDKMNFTLRIVDAKRVSTLKSLTPKR